MGVIALAISIGAVDRVKADPGPVDVTVTILRFIEVDDPDPAPLQGVGDYYARVSIGGQAFQDTFGSLVDDTPDISPFWQFTRTVDDTLGSTTVVIQIKDDDVGLAEPDDDMDLDPDDNDLDLTLTVNLANGTWGGDVPTNQGFSVGDGDTEHAGLFEGGERGKILFDIAVGSDGDIDDDGIPDGVERFGVRDGDGNIVADMAALGADPCRKTVALELDWMQGAADGHNHMPKAAAVTESINAFSGSTVPVTSPCPYAGFPNGTGANLVVDVSNSIPEAAVHGLGGDFDATRSANFNAARRPYFHYAVFVHDQAAGTSSSGLCCSGNKDFIVSLGSWRVTCVGPGANGSLDTATTGDDTVVGQSIQNGPDRTCNSTASGDDRQSIAVGTGAANHAVGTVRDQSGTILHELGHSLGIGHGGADGTNYKPNYLSVMNYAFDPAGIPDRALSTFRLDYSRSALNSLTEAIAGAGALSENAGIGGGDSFTYWTDVNGNGQGGRGDMPLDWDGDGTIDATNVNVDVNNDGACVSAGANNARDTSPAGDDVVIGTSIRSGPDHTCNTTAAGDDVQDVAVGTTEPSPLTGFDDWTNLKYRAAVSVNAGGAAVSHGPDITFPEAQHVELFFDAFFDPDLATTKDVDKADAAPGEALEYTVDVDNVGTGGSEQVSLEDTKPDGSTEVRSLPNIAAAGSHTETFAFTVPCTAVDLSVLTNTAVVSGLNLLGNPEENITNNTDTALTTVHAPVLTLAKSATPTVRAGEAITYVITYENTGSGTASNVVVTDTLPAGIYYSAALDSGSGPLPSSVTLNPDGSRTLVWNVGTVAGSSGAQTIEFEARPTLLALEGTTFTNNVVLDFQSTSGCVYPTLHASDDTTITVVAPNRNPSTLGFWRNHVSLWMSEILARIQATDQRYDTSGNGALSSAEVADALAPGGNQAKVLRMQLLAVYFNLATRRINAGTLIDSKTAEALGLDNVAEAALYAMETLTLPVDAASRPRYDDITRVLDEINSNKSEVYT